MLDTIVSSLHHNFLKFQPIELLDFEASLILDPNANPVWTQPLSQYKRTLVIFWNLCFHVERR